MRGIAVFISLIVMCEVSVAQGPVMKRHRPTIGHWSHPAAQPPPPLPSDADAIVKEHDEKSEAMKSAYQKQVKEHNDKTVSKLQPLQDKYTKAAKLDEAVAIRDKIRELKGIFRIDTWRPPQPDDIGKKFILEVTAIAQGPLWGTDVYTADSSPAMAAIHAGALQSGQKGVVEIEVLEGRPSYEGSSRNGVTSHGYGAWGVSYKIRKAD